MNPCKGACTRLEQVKLAVLENNGSITVIKKEAK
ncbi:YetF domain-containing protein [Bdellovibrio sp. ArHS]